MNSEWLTIPEAADVLGVSSRTIRRWIKAGRLPSELRRGPHGPQYFIPRSAVLSHRRAEEERTLRALGLDASQIARQLADEVTASVEEANATWRRELGDRLARLEQRLEAAESEISTLRQAVRNET